MPDAEDTSSPDDSSLQPSGRLGSLLRQRGLISAQQLGEALAIQRESAPYKQIGRVLVDLGFVAAEDVARVLAASVGLPFSILTPDMVRLEALQILPLDYIEQQNLLPLTLSEDWLTVAVEQFTDVFLTEEIGRRSACRVQIVAAEADNIRATRAVVVEAMGRAPAAAPADIPEDTTLEHVLSEIDIDDLQVIEEAIEDEADLNVNAGESPIVKLVNYIIKNAVEARASDVHIEPGETRIRVRYRVDGELVNAVRPPARLLPAVVSRIKILAGMDISERRLPQDGAVTITILDRAVDLRISTMTTRFGEKVVMRIVDRDGDIRGLEELGMEPPMLTQFDSLVRQPNGIVLVTGPTGSGKTSTLYSALSAIDGEVRNISTIEDPVERRLAGASQFQVHESLGFTFASALRSMLRQDPDVIMVGEIRDVETARLATQAALTGHLVLSTLHTNDAPTAIPRLINMGVEPYLVAASLRGVVAQRLVRAICPGCRESRGLSPAQAVVVERIVSDAPPMKSAFAGAGCAQCGGRGRLGRLPIFDLHVLTEEILSGIARDPNPGTVRHLSNVRGVPGLLLDGIAKVRQGRIDLEALLEVVACTEDVGSARVAA